jgi:ubiquitin thioesterase protein OTUB1
MEFSVVDQEAEIQREIESKAPMFSDRLALKLLEGEYSSNPNFLRKIPNLSLKFPQFRRTRGDGNCFYRSVLFSLLEQFIVHHSELDGDSPVAVVYANVLGRVKESTQVLSAAGFEPLCYEDFIDLLVAKMEMVGSISIEGLKNDFEDKIVADSIVMYSRFLVSAFLRMNQERFEGFIEGFSSVLEFCKSEVEPMDRESEQIQVMALAEAFGVRIRILYLDRSDSDLCNEITFPVDYNGPDFGVYLLYRPGHYDVLYPV